MKNYGGYFFKNLKFKPSNGSNTFNFFNSHKISSSFLNYQILQTYMFIKTSKLLSSSLSRSKCIASSLTLKTDSCITNSSSNPSMLEIIKALGVQNCSLLFSDLFINGRVSVLRMLLSNTTTPICSSQRLCV